MALKIGITEQIRELLRKHPGGLSITAIVREVPINRNTAGRYLESMMVSGQVEMRHFGMAKIYRLAQRVPLSAMLSISSDLIMLLDNSLRVLYANEPMITFLETSQKDLYGKNIEYTPCLTVFNDAFDTLKKKAKDGIAGREWSGELALPGRGRILRCRVAPAVFEEGQRGVSVLLEDVTEKRQAEERIAESERQFRLLAENSVDIIDRHLPDGTFIYVSPAITVISGFKPEEIIGHTAAEFIDPEDIAAIAKAQKGMTMSNPVVTVTYRARRRDGRFIWAESRFRGIFDEKTGKNTEIYGITRDITEQILSEEALRESEDRYRKLVEISPDAILLHQRGKIAYANPAALAMLHFSDPQELLGKSVLEIVHPAFRERIRTFIRKDLAGDVTPFIELDLLLPDGTTVPVEGRGVRTVVGGLPAIQVTMRDITDRRKTDLALQESREQYRSLAEAAPDLIFVINRDDTVEYVNSHAATLLGTSAEQLAGKRRADLFPGALGERQAGRLAEVFRTGRAGRSEGPIPIAGEERWFDHILVPMTDEKGTVVRVLGISRDIHDRKRAEEDLRESGATARALLNAPTDTIVLLDTRGTILDLNDTAVQRLGGRREELIGALSDTVLPPEVAKGRREKISKVITTKKAIRFVDASRGTWFDNVVYPIFNDRGDVVRLAIVARDITDQRRIETELRESEQRYRFLAETSRDLIFLIGRDDRVLFVNSHAAALLGKPASEIIGKPRSSFFPEDLSGRQEAVLQKVFSSATPVRREGSMRVGGELRWFDHSFSPAMGGETRVEAVLGVSRDITERKRLEDSLRESEERYRDLVMSSMDIIWEADDQARFSFVSPQAEAILGYSPRELVGRSPFDFLDTATREASREAFDAIIRSGTGNIAHESRWIHRDGHTVILETRARPVFHPDGSFSGIRGIDRDITGWIRCEAAIKETQKSFQIIAENAPDIISRILPDGTCAYVSPAVRTILGYEPVEVTGQLGFSYLHPDDLPHVQGMVRAFVSDGITTATDRFRMRHRDGSYILLEATIRAVRGPDGKVREFTMISRPVPPPETS